MPKPSARAPHSDSAFKAAHEVVGLYGDPDTSWGIAVDLGVRGRRSGRGEPTGWPGSAPPTSTSAPAPTVEVVPEADWTARRAELATTGFETGALLRVALRSDGRRS